MNKIEFQEKIKERLTYLMNLKHLSESQLSKKSNVGQSTINSILNKGRAPRSDILYKLCEGLEISIKDFFDFSPFDKNKTDNEEDLKSYVTELKKQLDEIERKIS